MADSLNFAVAGAAGRMGQQLVRAAIEAGHSVTGGSEAPGSGALGRDVGTLAGLDALGIPTVDNPGEAASGADTWVDFTRPAATLAALDALKQTGVRAVVIGTTGFSEEQEAKIADAAKEMTIVKAGNFSLGVNLLRGLVKQAARSLGEGWDIEILETHHRRKVDAPSGTALMLGDAAAEGRNAPLKSLRAAPYDGPDAARQAGQIGFSVRRSGGVIGEHEVTLASDQEIITLAHSALDRSVFAHGAIAAAVWAASRAPGLYDMDDVLGL